MFCNLCYAISALQCMLKQSLLIISMCLCGAMAAAGQDHSVLLKSDATVAAFGENLDGQCDIPALAEGATYIEIAGGGDHTVLLVGDGTAIACGRNEDGQCNIPALAEGVTYTQISAGSDHTLLLLSDGTAVACGSDFDGQCSIPALADGEAYGGKQIVLTVCIVNSHAEFRYLSGREFYRIDIGVASVFWRISLLELQHEFVRRMGAAHWRYRVVLPTGELLRDAAFAWKELSASKRRRHV